MSRILIVSLCSSSIAMFEPAQAEEIFDSTKSSNAKIAEQLANPIAAMKIIPIQINYDSHIGKNDGKRLVTNIQPVLPININKDGI